jgi:hypothetical protein
MMPQKCQCLRLSGSVDVPHSQPHVASLVSSASLSSEAVKKFHNCPQMGSVTFRWTNSRTAVDGGKLRNSDKLGVFPRLRAFSWSVK